MSLFLKQAWRLGRLSVVGGALLGAPAAARAADDAVVRKLEERVAALEHEQQRTAALEKELSRQQQRAAAMEQEIARQQQRAVATARELDLLEGDAKGKGNLSSPEAPAAVVRASKNVQRLELRGELRFRYEYDSLGAQANDPRSPVGGRIENPEAAASRNRFQLKLYADYQLSENYFAGVAVQPTLGDDVGNVTFSEGFDNYALYLWRFFFGWRTSDDAIRIVAGKQENPLYTETEMLWDGDVSPTGLTEQVKFKPSPRTELTFVGGQFFFYDNAENAYRNPRTIVNDAGQRVDNPNYVENGNFNTDAYLLYAQLVVSYQPNPRLKLTAAGGYQFYLGQGGTDSNGAVVPPPTTIGAGNSAGQADNKLSGTAQFISGNATRNLSLGLFSADAKLDLGAWKLKAYADAVYNFHGDTRVREEYGQPGADLTGRTAFAVGLTAGSDFEVKKQGDFMLLAEYRQVGLGSVDPNLNDGDFNISYLNFRGVKVALKYGIRPWLIFGVNYFNSSNLGGTDKNINVGVANLNTAQTVQVDLTTKF